jgi:hypothetical protein
MLDHELAPQDKISCEELIKLVWRSTSTTIEQLRSELLENSLRSIILCDKLSINGEPASNDDYLKICQEFKCDVIILIPNSKMSIKYEY